MIEPPSRTILLASLCMRSFESVLGILVKRIHKTDFKQNCVIGTPPFGKEQLHPMTKDAIYQSNQIVKEQIFPRIRFVANDVLIETEGDPSYGSNRLASIAKRRFLDVSHRSIIATEVATTHRGSENHPDF